MDLKKYIRLVPGWPKKDVEFKDIRPLLESPEAMRYVADEFTRRTQAWTFNKIVMLDARGFFFGPMLQERLGLPLIPIRKKGKLPPPVLQNSYTLEYGSNTIAIGRNAVRGGDRVLVVDDLLATGGTAKAACELIEELGGIVEACVFVVELTGLKGAEKLAGCKVESLVTYEF